MPCVEKTEPSLLFTTDFIGEDYANGYVHISDEIGFSSSDYGVELNIFKLDQSFQLLVNGNPIFIREAEFEEYGFDPNAPDGDGENKDDVRFVSDDGRYWYDTFEDAIYNLEGDHVSNTPIVKVVIDINGNVSMFGSRRSYDHPDYKLEPLYLTNGNGFNQVTWNSVGVNTVILHQTHYGPTNISFNTVGYKKVVCP